MKTSCRRLCLMVLLFICVPPPAVSTASDNALREAGAASAALQDVQVCIFQVLNGRMRPVILSGSELLRNPELELPGHVTGLLVLNPDPLTVRLEGDVVRNVRPDKGGTFHLTYYGKLLPQELQSAFAQAGWPDFDIDALQTYAGCYAVFAPVPGDALCPGSRFTIDLDGAGERASLRVQQVSGRRLNAIDAELAFGEGPQYSFLGNEGERFRSDAAGARIRLAAITAGIRHIEEMTGESLVTAVQVIDFEGRNNALTRNGFKVIWLYSQTFWNESPAELRTMVEHETLHLLADRCRFAQNGTLRELFADLRGLQSLSRERFTLITMGILPANASRSQTKDNALLAFINEMNFFKGMKGGHSRDNLDEFLASFLHTLVFIQDLERAVQSPVLFPDRFTRHLGALERKSLIDDYVRVIYALKAALQENSNVIHLLRNCLEHAARLQERLPRGES